MKKRKPLKESWDYKNGTKTVRLIRATGAEPIWICSAQTEYLAKHGWNDALFLSRRIARLLAKRILKVLEETK